VPDAGDGCGREMQLVQLIGCWLADFRPLVEIYLLLAQLRNEVRVPIRLAKQTDRSLFSSSAKTSHLGELHRSSIDANGADFRPLNCQSTERTTKEPSIHAGFKVVVVGF
jgi:hypothetical protein